MNILNIHGYNGSGKNTNYRILQSIGPNINVISPDIDYLSENADKVESYLSKLIEDNDINLIVATSFGAFFGKQLSVKYSIPLVATNPCLRPEISLKKIAPEYFNQNNSFFIEQSENVALLTGYERDVFILSDEDEVIDHAAITQIEASDATLYIVNGNHSLDEYIYKDIVVKEVLKYEKMGSCTH